MRTIDKLVSVCVTRHHEFVLYQSRCILVRDRGTGDFLDDHHALDERVSLTPTLRRTAGVASWDLVIHTMGFQIQVGPVVAVTKPNDSMSERIGQALGLFALPQHAESQRAVA